MFSLGFKDNSYSLSHRGDLKILRVRNVCIFNSEIFSAKGLRFPRGTRGGDKIEAGNSGGDFFENGEMEYPLVTVCWQICSLAGFHSYLLSNSIK